MSPGQIVAAAVTVIAAAVLATIMLGWWPFKRERQSASSANAMACAVWFTDTGDENRSKYILCRDEDTAVAAAVHLIEGCRTTLTMNAKGVPNGIQYDTGAYVAMANWSAYWEYQQKVTRDFIYGQAQRQNISLHESRMVRDPFRLASAPLLLPVDTPTWLGVPDDREEPRPEYRRGGS